VTWSPLREGDLHFVEDVEAAWRLWRDRREDIRQYLQVRYGRTVNASMLQLILQDCEYLTSINDAVYFNEMQRNGVTCGVEAE
jgi:hypothetical protein